MRNLIRSPLTWLVAAEFIVVGALVAVAWNVTASANRTVPPAVAAAPLATDDSGTDLPAIPQLNGSPVHGPVPGLAVDPNFWRDRLGQLNDDQVFLERLEWQIVHSAQAAAEHYLETVVLPAVQRAEHAGRVVVA
ncbi:MAG TPA: hypothetical protein VFK22_06385 [Candidatus Dormibacteraeota bacterium]|nr:hypothetical protein [Candidatus Dormibacteraeota bacterium]